MLAIAPHKVRMENAQHFPSSAEVRAANYPLLGDGKSAKLGWHMQDYNAHAAAGDKGHRLLAAVGEQLAALLQELIAFEPLI